MRAAAPLFVAGSLLFAAGWLLFGAASTGGATAAGLGQGLPVPVPAPAVISPPTPAPMAPPINPGFAAAPPDGLSPLLTQPGPLFPPPPPASPSYPPQRLPGPIDQQKSQSYRSDLLGQQRQLDRQGASPGNRRSREIQRQLNQPDPQ